MQAQVLKQALKVAIPSNGKGFPINTIDKNFERRFGDE